MQTKYIILIVLVLFLNCNIVNAEGFTVQSISKSNDSFLISLILNDGGEHITGYINGSEFEIPGIKVNSNIKFEVSKITEKLNYAVLNQGTLWYYSVIYYDASVFYDGAVCSSAPAYCFIIDIPDRIGFGADRIIIINRIPIGSYGGLQNPELSWIGTMALTIDGKQYKQNIGSGEAARGSVQLPIGSVQWLGSLVTGQAIPNQNLYVATHGINEPRWSIAPKTDYERYVKSLTETDTVLNVWDEQQKKYKGWQRETYEEMICQDVLCSSVFNVVTIHNANAERLLTKNVMIDYGAVTAKSSIAGYDGNIYDVIDRKISNPMILLKVKASALDIITLSGKPLIKDISVSPFSSGDSNGYVKVMFQNIGDAQGTFAARINGSFESNKITVPKGETGTLVLFLKDNLNASEIRKENVEIYDIASGASDSREFIVNVTQPKTFIPNTTRVYNDLETKSDITGMVEYKKQECSTGIWHFSNGEYQCTDIKDAIIVPVIQETIKPPQPFIIDPPKEEEAGFDYLWIAIILLIIILIALIVKYILSFNIFSMARSRQKKGFAPVMFVLGLLALLILYVLYWESVQDFANEIMNNMMIEMIKRSVKI